jgi:hypothetical protein
MKNPYGIAKDGSVVLASDPTLKRGLACGCTCPPPCGARLELHRGEIISPYFAHEDGADCATATQTALHMLAKEVLQEEMRLKLPPLRVYPSEQLGPWVLRKHVSRSIVSAQTIQADKVTLERKLGGIIPDVLFQIRDRSLVVEIRVSHAIDAEKKTKIEEMEIAAVEFDFSEMNRIVEKKDIKDALILGQRVPGQGWGEWVYHPDLAKIQREVDAEFLATKDAIHQRLIQEAKRKKEEAVNRNMREAYRAAEKRLAQEQRKQGSLFDS